MVKKLGFSLLIVSALSLLTALTIPFIVHSGGKMTGWITGLLILSEATFWTGGILLGKEVAKKYRSYLNPRNWKRKKNESAPSNNSATLKDDQ
ncbi:transporter suffix domain-containing protein [Paenibacillus pectinilyticus]|uniref:transporter suffix domain-containing protein n=1 Tax=Paenibacillus pectinilyticus TaxID=512399 RepID=UPI000A04C89B|nr:transporter suffix domain-containing protein [Paenibacillus pectinilyticus]